MVALPSSINHLITKALEQDQITKEFVSRVKSLINSGGAVSHIEIGKEINLGKSMFSQIMNGHKNIQPYKFRKFNEVYPCTDERVNEENNMEKKEEGDKREYSDQAMLTLAENNRRLLEIIIKQTEVHHEEARANRILAEANSNLINKRTSSPPAKKALQEFSAQLLEVIEQMAHRGVPDQWETFEEGRAILGRLVASIPVENLSKDTGGRRKSK